MTIKKAYQIKELSHGAMQITASSQMGIPNLNNIFMQILWANFDVIGPNIAFMKSELNITSDEDTLVILDAKIAEKVCGLDIFIN